MFLKKFTKHFEISFNLRIENAHIFVYQVMNHYKLNAN